MVKKKKKTNIKKKKVEQKADLQEPQKIMDDKSVIDESKPEEITTEEPEIEEGMVYCKSCKKEIEPYPVEHNKWRCPECNKYTRSPDMKGKDVEQLKEVKPSKDRTYEILSSRNIKFSGNELAQAEMLIQSGVATNFNDLAKKAFNILFLKEKVNKAFGIDRNTMELNQEPNPERTMKEIQQQKLMEAYIKSMDGGNKTDPLSMMMLMRMMDNKEQGKSGGDNGVMDKMLEIQMMKSVMGGQNSDTLGLQREIAELKHQMSTHQMLNQQQQMQQTGQSSQEFMQKMEQIRAERDKSVKQAEVNAQKEREKNLQLVFENRRVELENRLQAIEKEKQSGGNFGAQRIKDMKEEIAAIKDMSTLLGDREKGAGETIMDGLGTVAEKVAPALIELGKRKQQQAPIYQPQEPMMPQQIPPSAEQLPQEIPPEFPPEQPNPEPNPLGLSPTEQQMADQNAEMYIYTDKKKKE